LEKLITGAAVFLAVVCGQPDLLGVLCLYLFFAVLLVAAAIAAVASPDHHSPARSRNRVVGNSLN